MTKESRDEIVRAYERVSAELGFESLSAGLRYMCDKLEETLRTLRKVRNRESLEIALLKEPEPGREQLDAMVQIIRLFPIQLRKELPKATKEMTKKLPHEPGGRPRSLKPNELPEVCEEISQLNKRGASLGVAQKRVALRRTVSLRTVQRVWQKREEIFQTSVEDGIEKNRSDQNGGCSR